MVEPLANKYGFSDHMKVLDDPGDPVLEYRFWSRFLVIHGANPGILKHVIIGP
jgi:hypothetical protein